MTSGRPWVLLAVALGAARATAPATVRAQQRADPASAPRDARRAVERYERARVRHLPDRAGGGDRCDARIGRFCYWYDESEPDPPAEPPAITAARDTLLAALDRAAARAPADGWIAGQRVRYLVEAGRAAAARAAAATCRSPEPGWCASLAGLAAHADRDPVAADSAFAVALAALPPADRCRRTDLAPLLDGSLRDRYRRLGCGAGRDSLTRRLWWLAQPLWSQPGGNPLPGEHLARQTMGRLHEQARAPLGPVWGPDLHELLVRYGWPTAYTRDRLRERGAPGESPAVAGHEPRPAYHFLPALAAVERPAAARATDWALDRRDAPSRVAPGLRMAPLATQTAWFRRGDSTLVVAAAAPGGDTAFRTGWTGALVLARDEHTPPVVTRAAAPGGGRVVLTAQSPWRPALVGVEAVAADRRAARRLREGLGVPAPAGGRLALSAILLFDPADTLPTSLAGALPAMRPGVRARRAERVGLLWEVYGLPAATRAVAVSLGATRVGAPPLVRRAAEAVGLRRRPAPVALRWGAPVAGRPGPAVGAITLRLADLAPGRYRVTVTVASGAATATTSREIVVAP